MTLMIMINTDKIKSYLIISNLRHQRSIPLPEWLIKILSENICSKQNNIIISLHEKYTLNG